MTKLSNILRILFLNCLNNYKFLFSFPNGAQCQRMLMLKPLIYELQYYVRPLPKILKFYAEEKVTANTVLSHIYSISCY